MPSPQPPDGHSRLLALQLNNGTAGGAYYEDRVITDPSIFNFYDSLLDGPNKHDGMLGPR